VEGGGGEGRKSEERKDVERGKWGDGRGRDREGLWRSKSEGGGDWERERTARGCKMG